MIVEAQLRITFPFRSEGLNILAVAPREFRVLLLDFCFDVRALSRDRLLERGQIGPRGGESRKKFAASS
jgi:hypothetical protein